tara:strand:+ start:5613 stop:5816 length:204 start_codon:yes stop_codon:yes gene_type:complete
MSQTLSYIEKNKLKATSKKKEQIEYLLVVFIILIIYLIYNNFFNPDIDMMPVSILLGSILVVLIPAL